MRGPWIAAALAFATLVARPARADEPKEPERPPLAESLLTESATDLDATEAGELELEANVATLGARRGGARVLQSSVEAEWRVFDQVGMRVEPNFARSIGADGASASRVGVDGALAFGLFHDFARDIHLQAELLAHTMDEDRTLEPGNADLPLSADLLAAWRVDRLTLRATVGAEAGASYAHAPLHTDLALLTGFTRDERFGFFGFEVRSDWAREAPLVLAPDVVADLTSIGLPFRVGVALPIEVGGDDARPSYGVFLRIMMMTAREAEYGRTGGTERDERGEDRK